MYNKQTYLFAFMNQTADTKTANSLSPKTSKYEELHIQIS